VKPPQPEKEQIMNTKLNVLVIDDDAVVGRSFDRVLTDKGYHVVTALSGEEGLSTMNENDFDVVFTDIKMPGMDGLEVTESIKARCPWTPVVVITGFGTEENESRAAVLGANGFVRKPLTPEMIESVTLKAIGEATKHAAEHTAPETVTVEKTAEPKKTRSLAGTIGMFFAAPFIALAYVIALPFIGFYHIAKLAFEAYAKNHATGADRLRTVGRFARNVGLFLASPFIALGYVIALPFVGFFMFTRLALEAYAKRHVNV
jgi:CheY-like chemotaxis protein